MTINWEETYNRLWEIINAGGNDKAPEYFSGNRLIKAISKVDYSLPSNYYTYISERQQKKLPTSRAIYFKELIQGLPAEKKKAAYAAIFKELDGFDSPQLRELKKMFGGGGDEKIQVVEAADPIMSNNTYQETLRIIDIHLKSLEKDPGLYNKFDEESTRTYVLNNLVDRFKSTTATAETFNKSGKTDIILRHTDGSNLFVAECKIWNGPAVMNDAIDQLIGYLTWRDSKAALIFFVRNTNFSAVLESIKKTATEHTNFIDLRKGYSETSLATIFHFPNDLRKRIEIEILAYHYPPGMK